MEKYQMFQTTNQRKLIMEDFILGQKANMILVNSASINGRSMKHDFMPEGTNDER